MARGTAPHNEVLRPEVEPNAPRTIKARRGAVVRCPHVLRFYFDNARRAWRSYESGLNAATIACGKDREKRVDGFVWKSRSVGYTRLEDHGMYEAIWAAPGDIRARMRLRSVPPLASLRASSARW